LTVERKNVMQAGYRRKSAFDTIFDLTNGLFMLLVCFITLYPIWNCLVVSLNDGTDALRGGIYWWPRKFSIDNYKVVFVNTSIIKAFGISIARTVITTSIHVFFTAMIAYALSKKWLFGRKAYMAVGTVTLFFSGGLIPYFILIKQLHLYDNFLVYVVPAMFNFFHLLIFQAFFREIPETIEESARIDGANDFTIFVRIILRLSTPVLATIALFTGVYNWNDYFVGVIFIHNQDLLPIQTFLYKVIAENSSNKMIERIPGWVSARNVTSETVKLATMVVTTLPIVCIYPFLQKYFVKGMMLGAVKG
jgi:putative aldouronate transport system permease protein